MSTEGAGGGCLSFLKIEEIRRSWSEWRGSKGVGLQEDENRCLALVMATRVLEAVFIPTLSRIVGENICSDRSSVGRWRRMRSVECKSVDRASCCGTELV